MPSPATFRIRFDGTLTPGADIETVKANLARIFRQDAAKIEPLFAGRAVTIKRALSEASARKYVEALRQAGAVARMEAEEPVALALEMVPITPDDEGRRRAPPELAPRSTANAGPDNGAQEISPEDYKSPLAVLANAQQAEEEHCELRWFSSPVARIGRLRLIARSGVLMAMMLVAAFVGSSIIARTLPVFAGGVLVGTMMAVALFIFRLSNANLHGERPGVSVLDVSLLLGVLAFLIILSMGMSFRANFDPTDTTRLFLHIGIFNSIIIAVARIALMTQQIRRLHDMDRSGWWCLLFLIPYLGPLFFLLLILKSGDEEGNEYGLPPPPNTLPVNLGVFLFMAITLFALVSSEAASFRLPARYFLGLTTMLRPKVSEVPQIMPPQGVPPEIADVLNLPPLSQPQASSDSDVNDFTRYSNKENNLFRAFQQAGNALDTAQRDAQALERWNLGEALERALRVQIAQTQESIEVRKRDRASPVSSTMRLPKFADIFDRGVGRTQDIMERLEGLYADLLVNAQKAGTDKAAFQKDLAQFKDALSTLKQDHASLYAQTRQEMCTYTRNPDDALREYLSDPRHVRAEWCN